MKIGILTLSLRHNYGGILQAYALQTVLKRMGHDARLVRFMPEQVPFKRRVKHWIKGRVKNVLGRPVHRLFSDYELDHLICKELNRFIEEKIQPTTSPIRSMDELQRLDELETFDAYVVGSDQVWRAEYARKFLPAYFCTFTDRDVVRISYAASFGNSEWNVSPEELSVLKAGIARFKKVMVRENSGVDLCKELLGVDADVVLDPTMLLTRDDYLALLPSDRNTKPNGVFEYFLDRNEFKKEVSENIQMSMGLHAFSIDLPDVMESVPLDELVMHPIEEWISCFERAEYVVTDSFHGCVFSIIFNKPFAVIGNHDRGFDRFRTLLEHFGLTDCLVTAEDGPKAIATAFDWMRINACWSERKITSSHFLEVSLAS